MSDPTRSEIVGVLSGKAGSYPFDGLIRELRDRRCQAGEAWTTDDPDADHGHTDCWLHSLAANVIEELRTENEAFREAIRTGDGPHCDVVCIRECIGVCGAADYGTETPNAQ